jgi:hypothetical protein
VRAARVWRWAIDEAQRCREVNGQVFLRIVIHFENQILDT